jgi:hypothetical protein
MYDAIYQFIVLLSKSKENGHFLFFQNQAMNNLVVVTIHLIKIQVKIVFILIL